MVACAVFLGRPAATCTRGICPCKKKAMIRFDDAAADERIRAALRDAYKKGKLDVIAAVTGIAGGTKTLRKLMAGTEELSILDKCMLGVHLG